MSTVRSKAHPTPRLSLLCVVIVICVSSFMAPPAIEAGAKPALYAVVIGVNEFVDSGITPLAYPQKDANDFYEFLRDIRDIFSGNNVSLLLNKGAKKADIINSLREGLGPAQESDIVIIYLSGHGAADNDQKYYYVAHDTTLADLSGTGVLMNDRTLFGNIRSKRVLLVSDACHSGGFQQLVAKATAAQNFFNIFETLDGRVALTSSKPQEQSYELKSKYQNSIFTHHLLKGLRGEAKASAASDVVSVKELYKYVYENTTKDTTKGGRTLQHPQLFCPKEAESEPAFVAQAYERPLTVGVDFVYEKKKGEETEEMSLIDGSVLKSGQRYGIRFRPDADCHVYAFWWDADGAGVMYPNPTFGDSSGKVAGGKTHWIPSKDGEEHWYILGKNKGDERIYFVASRKANPKLERICQALKAGSSEMAPLRAGKEDSTGIEHQIGLMAPERRIEKKVSPTTPKPRQDPTPGKPLDDEIKISGPDGVYTVQFGHE
jgi:hypothetical protein